MSNDLLLNLGQQASKFEGDHSLLAEQIVTMLKKSINEFGTPLHINPHFDSYRRDQTEENKGISSSKTPLSMDSVLPVHAHVVTSDASSEVDDKFHEMVSVQVKQTVRTFEWKLDSVRKEREAVIDLIEGLVRELFEPKRGER